MPLNLGLPLFEHMQWALPFAVTLHNLEEGIWLPGWADRHPGVLPPWRMSALRFRMSLIALTVAAYLITWVSVSKGRDSFWTWLFVAYTGGVFLNVLVPHLPATFILKRYTPGVVTAVMLNLPVTALLLAEVFRDRVLPGVWTSVWVFGLPLAAAAVAAVKFMEHYLKRQNS